MPKYSKNREGPPFRRRFPGVKNLKHMSTILAKLTPEQWQSLQQTASESIAQPYKKKVLPSSYQKIVDTEFPMDFNRHLAEEEHRHNDHSQEFHKGGGLGTAINSVLSQTWDQIGGIPVVGTAAHWLYDSVVTPNYGDDLTQMDTWNADVLEQAYNRDVSTRAASIHGWLRVPRYDTSYLTVYYDPESQQVHVGIRGSKSLYDWYHHNKGILTSQHPGREETNRIREDLVQISKDFPNHDLTVASHSLSGAFLTDAFNDASPEDTLILNNYDHLLYYNPGSSPLADTESIEKILKDDRVRLFINKSDLINQTYNQMLTDDNSVVFGEPAFNPLSSHNYSQWASDDQEFDKEVSWGSDAWQQDIGGWDVGENTQAALGDT